MAETYKGLTIRIGGDTTNLQKALRSTDSAITRTQTQLRKMSQALRMDPGSTSAITQQLNLMGNKAVETQRRLTQLRKSIQSIGSNGVEIDFGYDNVMKTEKSVEQLTSETGDVSRRAAEAADNYNKINAELEQMYRHISQSTEGMKDFAGMNLRDLKTDIEGWRQALVDNKVLTDEEVDSLIKLRDTWASAFEENAIAKALVQFRDLQSETIKTEANVKQTVEAFAQLSTTASKIRISPQIDSELSSIRSASENVADSLDRAQSALKLDPTNANAAVASMERLSDAAELAEDEITLINKRMEDFKAAGVEEAASKMGNVEKAAQRTADELKEAASNLTEMKGKLSLAESSLEKMSLSGQDTSDEFKKTEATVQQLRSEVDRLTTAYNEAADAAQMASNAKMFKEDQLRVAELQSSVRSYKQSMQELAGSSKVFSSQTLMSLGMTLSTSVTPAIVSMGHSAIQSAQEIDSAYRDMRKTVNGTEDDYERLRQAAIDFSTTHVTSADQILSIQAIGGELGVAVEDLETFAETVSNLEIATDLDADEAATALGQLSNIMNDLDGSTMPAFSDALVRLGNNGASTESQIVDIAARIGSMASILGMSTPQVLAWASTIASTGQNAEAAGTAISNTMMDIENAVSGGGDALEAFAQIAGMSADEFAQAWTETPSAAMEAFIKGLNDVEDNGGSATATLNDLGITATRQIQAIEGLMQTVGMLDDNLEMSGNAWNGVSDQWGEAGDAANEASKKAEGFSGAIQRMLNMAQVLGAEFGEALAPAIDVIADLLGTLTDIFSHAPDSVKQFIAALLGISAASGPFLLFARAFGDLYADIGKFVAQAVAGKAAAKALGSTAQTAATAVKSVGEGASEAASGASVLSGSLGGLKAGLIGIGVAVAGIGISAIISGFADMQKKTENLTKATDGLGKAASRANQLDQLSAGINNYGEQAEYAVKGVNELAEYIANSVDAMNESTSAAEDQILQLSAAQQIINEYAGQTDLTTEAQGRLQWALQLVNEQFGLSLSAQDAANNKYTDTNGEVQTLTDSINGLIEAKKNEVRVNALTQNMTQAYNDMVEAQKTLVSEQQKYDDYYNNLVNQKDPFGNYIYSAERAKELTDKFMGDSLKAAEDQAKASADAYNSMADELGDAVAAGSEAAGVYDRLSASMDPVKFANFNARLEANGESFTSLKGSLEELGAGTVAFANLSEEELAKVANSYNGSKESIIPVLNELGVSTTETRNAMTETFAQIGEEVPAQLEELGYNLDDLSGYLIMAGISSEQMASIGGDALMQFAEFAGGDIQTLISIIGAYNNTPIYDKNGNITSDYSVLLDAEGHFYIWNGTVLKDINGNIICNRDDLPDTIEELGLYQDQPFDDKDASVNTNFGGDTTPSDAAAMIDDLSRRDGTVVTTDVVTNYITNYKTNGSPSSGSLSSSLSGSRSRAAAAPASYSAATFAANAAPAISMMASRAAVPAVTALSDAADGISLMASNAASTARRMSVTVVEDNARERSRLQSRTPPYPGSGVNAQTNANAVNITIDGIGTTGRVQEIALNLLDELEKVGAI